jgi:hypothetical protein
MNRVKIFLKIWRNGRKDGYPRCCVLHYSLIEAWTRTSAHQAVRRGYIKRDNMTYVPCLWHQRLATPYPYRIARIDEHGRAHLVIKEE